MPGVANVRNTLELRKFNKKQVIEALRKRGPLTKSEISFALGLSISTVGNICRELLVDGIVSEEAAGRPSGGRDPKVTVLKPASRFSIGLDLTRNEQAVLRFSDLRGAELACATLGLAEITSSAGLADAVRKAVFDLLAERQLPSGTVLGMGVIVPGWYDQSSGRVLNSTNPLIEGAFLKRDLEAALSFPVLVGNDANLGTLALTRSGAEDRAGFVALVYVGTGLGVGVARDGTILDGSRGFAAEIAHLPLGDPKVECYCGNSGCIEGIVSLPGLVRMYFGPGSDESATALEEIIRACRAGEPRAREAFECFADHLGLAVSVVVNAFDCEVVYLGGIVDSFFNDVLPHVNRQVLKRVRFAETRSPQIRPVGCTQAVLFAGCAELVFQHWIP